MRLRNKPWVKPELDSCPFFLSEPFGYSGKWRQLFSNNNPLWLELGCGKGLFLAGYAPFHPEINFVGADIKNLMLAFARRNIQSAYDSIGQPVTNCKLLSLDIERIRFAFQSEDRIDRIIINFPNPWPKEHHKKRRLTHTRQLLQYKEILTEGGEILFKTDNDELFAESIPYFQEAGLTVLEYTDDYYRTHAMIPELLTEHEKKFLEEGLPIHFIHATK